MTSHLLPYALYVVPTALAEWLLPPSARVWADPVRVAAAAVALVAFLRRGAYPELPVSTTPQPRARHLAWLAGLAVALLWMPLAELVPSLGARGGFHPEAAGPAAVPFLWATRIVGFVLVAPLAEEFFVRSLLPRWIDAPDAWRERPVGSFTPLSAAVSILFFTATHPEWLAAFVTALLWTAVLRATGRLRDVVVAHAVANAALAVWWAQTGDRSWW